MSSQQSIMPKGTWLVATIGDSTGKVGEYLYGFYSGVTKYKSCGHDVIWVIVDQLTKMCRFIPTKTMVMTLRLAR